MLLSQVILPSSTSLWCRSSKANTSNIENLTPNFWMKKIKWYKLNQVVPKWWTIHQHIKAFSNYHTITIWHKYHNVTHHQLIQKHPYLFFWNEVRLNCSELAFFWNERNVYIFCAQDRHHEPYICFQSFQLQSDANFRDELYQNFELKKYVGRAWCWFWFVKWVKAW
jgi:hypothetical protein